MSSVNYNLKNKGVRLISAETAWVSNKNGKRMLSPKYRFIGKVQMSMPNMVITADDKAKPKYKGNMVAQKNRLCKIKTLRNEKPWIYKLPPHSFNGMRNNGKKENDSHNGYGIVRRSDTTR